jgi:predicted nucleic acid-binding protein
MNLIFDTSILVEIERKNKKLLQTLQKHVRLYPAPAQITFMTYHEFYHGVQPKNIKNKDKALAFLRRFGVLPLSTRTAEILSELKTETDGKGYTLPLADLLIASQVIESNGVLVTRDSDFEKIERLKKIIL